MNLTHENYSTMTFFAAFWNRSAKALCSLFFAATCLVGTAYADDLKEIYMLTQDGRYPQALGQVESYLLTHHQDVRAEFIKGVILARQEKRADAIAVFSELTKSHPELPEPYNNLAVLYAGQGQYEKARLALELAMKTHPSYSVAYANLSSVYAKMASDSYDKALQVNRGVAHPVPSLALLDDMVRSPTVGSAGFSLIKTAKLPNPAPVVALTTPVKPSPPAVVATSKPVENKPAPSTPPAAAVNPQKTVLVAVEAWAAAWSAKDIKNYLACYANDFKTPNGESREGWAKGRKERINKPVAIKVQVLTPKISIQGNHAIVEFKQSYRAGDVVKRTNKTLHLHQVASRWLIEREEASK